MKEIYAEKKKLNAEKSAQRKLQKQQEKELKKQEAENKKQQAELEKREKLELKYNNILKDRNKTAKELYQNAKAQLDSLEKSRNLNAEAYEKRKAELQLEAKQATAQYTNDTRFNMKWGTGLVSGKGSSSGLHVIDLAGSGGGGSEDTKKDQGKRTMLSEAELGRYATFNWDDNTVEINWDAVNQITDQQKGRSQVERPH